MARPLKPLPIASNLPKFNSIIPVRRADLFDSSDFVYELKYDGFRALAYSKMVGVDSYRAREMK
jgi:ATP-dependent DNA ligase